MNDDSTRHVDVLIVGAGITGIGTAWHLRTQRPHTRFVVLEAKDGFGGTWVTHRYPGIRSDSDLYTFGYRFKPWRGAPIATADQILKYLGEVIDENALAPHIRYRHRVDAADWDERDRRWHLRVTRLDTGETLEFSAGFLFMGQGYYDHGRGYTPTWPGMASYAGRIVHPQDWPDELDCTDKRVLVIGSGATAATLIPALAGRCAHITMLQRSPTYFRTARNANDLADQLRLLEVPEEWTHEIVRRKILYDQGDFARKARAHPDAVKAWLLDQLREVLHDDELIERHFTPRYRPWQQRLAFVPDADLFHAIRRGQASVVTDQIETFTPGGVRLVSGGTLDADIVVTATGFRLCAFGDIPFRVAGQPVDFSRTVAWRGAMLTGVPNMMFVFGYLRWSWTLRVDLLGDLLCRLLGHLQDRGAQVVVPALRPEDEALAPEPWVQPDNFNPGYLARGLHQWPRQLAAEPWSNTQDYELDRKQLPVAPLDDGTLRYA